ncbi:phosphotransferase family protein [Streptomyces longwoodensis]|uniref:phosphotransferase family protein n=1 Tax=Streptomyces longwoodensis TaxID=68231 RepID=UPI0036F6FF6C
MDRVRRHLTPADLAPLARAALGPRRTLDGVERLRGGSRKGVYRLRCDDGATAVAYVWSSEEDYWDHGGHPDPRDPFSAASGPALFAAAHDRLTAVGVRTPRLLHLGTDAAVVEDVTGGSLEEALARDPAAAAATLGRLGEAVRALGAHTSAAYGKVAVVDAGGSSHGTSCVQVVRDRALRDVEEAAGRDPRIAAVREEAAERLGHLAEGVRPRTRHALVHGELGPDHVLVAPDGAPVLIDVEGLMYFDVEQEHVFLELRFGPHYDRLRVPGLDGDRLRLYRLALHLSLVAGPLRLLGGDFPDAGAMRGIAEFNLRRVLSLLRPVS